MENPFFPSRSRVCQLADWVMIFSLAFAGLLAAIATLISQVLA
jgi:preprotein translocase subunit SecE